MKHSVEAVRAALGAPPRITARPTQTSLWALKTHLINGLWTMAHPDHPDEGFGPYLRTAEEQALVSPNTWTDPANPGHFFVPSQAAVTDRLISVKESGYRALKDLSDSFENVKSVLVRVFLDVIPTAYHSGAATMGQKGFGNLAPREILFRLVHLYGKPTLAEVQQCLTRLAVPMDRIAPVEVMLRDVEEC